MTIAAGSAAVAADLLVEHNADGTHKAATGTHISHTALSDIGANTHAQIDTHIASVANPLHTKSNSTQTASTVETTVLTATLTANQLGTTGGIRARVWFDAVNASVGNTYNLTIKVKYDDTTILTFTHAIPPSKTFVGELVTEMLNTTASAQRCGGSSTLNDSVDQTTVFAQMLYGTAAEDSTTSKDFTITFQTANADLTFNKYIANAMLLS